METPQTVRSGWVERCKAYQFLMTCGHIETRMMREATAGVPWTAETVITASAQCAKCDPSKAASKPQIRTLTCCCCGDSTRGQQWWNRDTGYGMCSKCIAWLRGRGTPEEEIRNLYGVEGVHWGVC